MTYRREKADSGDIILSVRENYLFRGLSEEFLAKAVNEGEILFAERGVISPAHRDGNSFLFLLKGILKCTYKTGKIQYVKSGSPVKLTALMEGYGDLNEIRAVRDSLILKISRDTFLEYLPKGGIEPVLSSLLARISELEDASAGTSSTSIEEDFFMFIRESYGLNDSIVLDLSRSEICSILGLDPAGFSVMINSLRNMGVIVWEGDSMTLNREYVINKLKIE